MNRMLDRVWRNYNLVVSTAFWIAAALSMRQNAFNVSNAEHFENFADQTESFVIGRANSSKQEGFFAHGMLLGRDTATHPAGAINQFQLETFLRSTKVKSFKIYPSTPGGSGWLFSLFHVLSPWNPKTSLSVYRWFVSLLSSGIVAALVFYLGKHYGRLAATALSLGLMFSPMLTVAGGHIYWMFGIFLLPMLPIAALLASPTKSVNRAVVWSSIAFFLKCIFTGFELVTASWVASLVVLGLVLSNRSHGLAYCRSKLVLLALGMTSGLLLALAVLTVQISAVRGSYTAGVSHFMDRFEARTAGSRIPGIMWSTYSPISAESSSLDVVKYYRNLQALTAYTPGGTQIFGIRYQTLFWLFALVTLIGFFAAEVKLKSLIFGGWLSFLGPLSWFTVFKAHALLHPQLDVLVWYLPTMIFIYASFGAGLTRLIRHGERWMTRIKPTNS